MLTGTTPPCCWLHSEAPAYVLGSNGGAQIGLNLAVRYPERVQTLVAHEPPGAELLPRRRGATGLEGMRVRHLPHEWGRSRHEEVPGAGLGGAWQPDETAPQSPPTPRDVGGVWPDHGQLGFLLRPWVKPISRYVPDVVNAG
jgi:pimeloyl-ACP methyl ester carboxylesterase